MKKKLTIADMITLFRIVGTASLFFVPPSTGRFYIIYTLCGISDVLDGLIARMTHTTSERGAKLDSVADLLLYSVMIIRIFPFLWETLPQFVWFIVFSIAFVRVCSYIIAAIKFRVFSSLHTYLNKITGFGVFLVPYMMTLEILTEYCVAVCVMAALSTLEELLIHLTTSCYNPKRNSLFKKIA